MMTSMTRLQGDESMSDSNNENIKSKSDSNNESRNNQSQAQIMKADVIKDRPK